MTKIQQIYREIRKYMSREDARYSAPRIYALWVKNHPEAA